MYRGALFLKMPENLPVSTDVDDTSVAPNELTAPLRLTKKARYAAVLHWFALHMPVAETELHHGSPFELLVAVVLSAQCTDKRVNLVTPALFEAFPTPQALANADADDIFRYIRSVSYPNNKARHLAGLGRMLIHDYHGEVPATMEELIRLPGVGRKTANVMLSNVFDTPAMAVDTHVFRVSARIGLTYKARTPLETERQLTAFIPRVDWAIAHHWLILHGRYVCLARRPQCEKCGLRPWCKYYAARERAAARLLLKK